MNFSAKKSKTRSCLQPHRQPSSTVCNDPLKYVIIDSQNQEQLINMRPYDSVFQPDPFGINEDRKSVIMKSKGSTMANFLVNQNVCDTGFDKQIFTAENEVKRLSKECNLIQQMIVDMIQEQAKIQVSLRKAERRQSLNKSIESQDKRAFFSNYQTKAETQASSEVRQTLQSKLWSANFKTPIYITTPMTSQIVQKQHKKSLQIVKTVEISSKAKLKKSKQNITPHKKIKTMKSIPKLKSKLKSHIKISRRKSKVF